jgi:hypothetical protein
MPVSPQTSATARQMKKPRSNPYRACPAPKTCLLHLAGLREAGFHLASVPGGEAMTISSIGVAIGLVGVMVGAVALLGLIKPKMFFGAPSRQRMLLGLVGSFILLISGVAIVGIDADQRKIAAASAPQPVSAQQASAPAPVAPPEPEAPQQPADQVRFVEAVMNAERAYFDAETEMAQGGTRAERRVAICAALKGPVVQNWIGTVNDATSDNDGRGILTLHIARGIGLGTTNNSLSNPEFDTLIAPGSSVFKAASALVKGDTVQFSGTFFPDDQDCVREVSDTLRGSMTDPEFLFRFIAVKKL